MCCCAVAVRAAAGYSTVVQWTLCSVRLAARHARPSLCTNRPLRLPVPAAPQHSTQRPLATIVMARGDASSFANVDQARILHSSYELDVDFNARKIDGYAKMRVEVVQEGVGHLVLDTRGLTIERAELHEDGKQPTALEYSLADPHVALGQALKVKLPSGLPAGGKVEVGVRFSTAPSSSALQWLDPEQTADGKRPYLFTQCQAIHARSFVPCQDSPAVKMTYSAAVRVPADLTALMSAVPSEDSSVSALPNLPASSGASSSKVFGFEQRVPIPSYLVALAVGQLESRELSGRSRVWSEPSMVDAAAYEFAETAKYLEAAESLAGEYVWGRYDLLLLPPSFPYGGMENPCLTFCTPTLLAGDRSLTNVVALNEGWTVFLERKILGRLQGEAALQFRAARGALDLAEDVKRIGPTHNFTRLVPDLSGGEDPDDAFSRVPYEKGFYFLYYLQELMGRPSAFEPFMRAYLQHFALKTVDSQQFKEYFLQHFRSTPAASTVDWDTWLHAPGMPPVQNSYDTSLAETAYQLASRWHTADVMGIGASPPDNSGPADIAGWGSDQVVAFLERLSELRSMTPLAASMCRALDAAYGLDGAKNCEKRCAWYKLCISAEDASVLPGVKDMLATQGRMKYLRPLYRALYRSKSMRQVALDTFEACKERYHPIARKMVAADLKQ